MWILVLFWKYVAQIDKAVQRKLERLTLQETKDDLSRGHIYKLEFFFMYNLFNQSNKINEMISTKMDLLQLK